MNWKHWVCIAWLCMASFSVNAVTPMISTGYGNSMFLHSDGSVWGIGSNPWARVSTSPVQILRLPGTVAASYGNAVIFALLADGTLWAAGWNGQGQLGDGTTASRSQVQQVPGLAGISAVAASPNANWNHVLALGQDGTVWSWGSNSHGQLGDGTKIDHYSPAQILGLTGITSISAANQASMALRADGTVWVWGQTCCGKTGNGKIPVDDQDPESMHLVPTQVQNLDRVIAVAAGDFHHMALRDDGTVWVWGSGGDGENGTGTFRYEATPVQIPGLDHVVAISNTGYRYSVVLKSDGTIWTFGSNNRGQLGVANITYSNVPVQVPGIADAIAISAGWSHVVALRRDGSLVSWGSNDFGQLGDNGIEGRAEPRAIVGAGGGGLFNSLQPVPAGYNQLPQAQIALNAGSGRAPLTVRATATNASDADGTIQSYAWATSDGQRASGASASLSFVQAGTYTIDLLVEDNAGGTGIATPQKIVVLPGFASVATTPKIRISDQSSLATDSGGRVLAWGAGWKIGLFNTLGSGPPQRSNAYPIAGGITGAIDISVGGAGHALLSDGTVLGWGVNDYGGVGADSLIQEFSEPQRLPNLSNIKALADGWRFGLALGNDGRVYSWGYNVNGELGLGDNQNRFHAVQVPSLDNVVEIAAASNSSAALKGDGTVWTWGAGWSNLPAQVPGLANISRVFAASQSLYAQDSSGAIWASGVLPSSFAGDAGPVTGFRRIPALDGMAQIAGSSRHMIALRPNGTVWTGGQQSSGALGILTDSDIAGLQQVPGIYDAIAVAAADSWPKASSLVLRGDGRILSWGANANGQLGDGTLATRLTPVAVLNETADGFLDLFPGADFELPPGVGVPFFAVTSGNVAEVLASVNTRTKFNVGDLGKTGEVFVTATVPVGSLVPVTSPMSAAGSTGTAASAATASSSFVLVNLTASGQWQPVTNGQVLPYATGVLGDQLSAQTILDNTDTTNLKGAQFCLGYGASAAQMIASGTMRVVASIPDPNAMGAAAPTCILAGPPVSYSLALPQGWSLLGNSLNHALAVSTLFNDTNAITSVWKWDANTFGWQFYTPLMSATELQTYVASKGYAVLATINPGEGYWVNARSQPTIGTQSGDSFILTGMNLAKGWNLVATGNDIAPTEFSANLKASAVPANLKTLWAWDNPSAKWFFYAPSLEAQGATALSDYVVGKGYIDFATANKKLGNGTGFWVNR